ncbi:phage regulatory protein/antirepressor Ant [uncultured Desulfobacter sp.]|uniref:phage regulatory protein/antirepressor Ant n=1 Tax=uncultured Desulfobacter sp. TaxID=240139 RepID=UPI0029F5309F|nr:phage regulatory protein/antirepressor Ant [uncultured Desulfobacter sp.]
MKALYNTEDNNLYELNPIEETNEWSSLFDESEELFLQEADNAGLVEGEDYLIDPDGSILTATWCMDVIYDYLCNPYAEKHVFMDELVVLNDNNVPTTTSLKVADVTGKRHADVIRKIESLECSIEFAERNIALSSYTTSQNKEMKMYNLTRDGMSFLIHKMSGEKAAEFTEKFIGAFNMMEAELLSKAMEDFQIPQTYGDALMLAAEQARQLELQAPKVEAYDDFLNCDGLTNLTDGFKSIGLAPGLTIQWMCGKYLYRSKGPGKSINKPYQRFVKQGLFAFRNAKNEDSLVYQQTLLTPKGIAYFEQKKLNCELPSHLIVGARSKVA